MLWQELIIRLIVVSRSEPRVGKIIKINETLLFHRISPNCSWKHLSNFAGVTAILIYYIYKYIIQWIRARNSYLRTEICRDVGEKRRCSVFRGRRVLDRTRGGKPIRLSKWPAQSTFEMVTIAIQSRSTLSRAAKWMDTGTWRELILLLSSSVLVQRAINQ